MRKLHILKNIQIKDASYEYIDDIINFIKEQYGNNYPEREFYDESVIRKYIKRALRRDKAYFKCVFLNDKLIGQSLAIIEHGIAIIKLTIISKEYRHYGILSLISFHMAQYLKDLSEKDLKCIYAFIVNKNTNVTKFIGKYNFSRLGTVPAWDIDNYFVVFGRVEFDLKWKLISPHIKLCQEVYNIIKNAGLKRLISARLLSQLEIKGDLIDFKLEKDENIFPHKIKYISLQHPHEGRVLAEFHENKYTKSWYNFRFIDILPSKIKFQIIRNVLNDFKKSDGINSLSFSVNVNDRLLQKFLLDLGAKFYAFMPFYANGEDVLLMGKSKISMDVEYGK